MYRKRHKEQLTMDDFILPFGGKLLADNRWVKLSRLMPWDYIEEIYAKSMSSAAGASTISACIAFGAIYIKESEKLTDERTVENIAENPYMQYFLGLHAFEEAPLFDSSMMVHFRKRFPSKMIEAINQRIFADKQDGDSSDGSSDEPRLPDGGETAGDDAPANSGKLVLDATCAPADIRYPSDLSLLNEARENTEAIIDKLWEQGDRTGHKTRYRRKKARSEYLSITKQKKPKHNKTHKAIHHQLIYIQRNLEDIGKYLTTPGIEELSERQLTRLATICVLYRQQKGMYENRGHQCEDRIVSLRQPHIRPMIRGKAGKPYEFGQKLALSVVNGYTFIERQSFDNFNEGVSLIESTERYRSVHGHYPEVVQADKIYRNRKNLSYCKEHGIRLSGPRLGRPGKDAERNRELEYKDCCERNIIEGRNGMAKRRYGLDLIMAILPETAMTEAALQVLCMNARIRLLWRIRFWICLSRHRFALLQ